MRFLPRKPGFAMYVCVCNGITDRDIREAASAGCSGMAELTMRTGCGACCGSCVETASEVLEAVHAQARQRASVQALGLPVMAAAA